MIDPAGRDGERGLDVVHLQIGKFLDDLGLRESGRQQVEHIYDAYPQPADTRPATEFVGLGGDTAEQLDHIQGIPRLGPRNRQADSREARSPSPPRRTQAAVTPDVAVMPDSASQSRIFCLGMAPTFMAAIWPSLNTIIVGMPRTP